MELRSLDATSYISLTEWKADDYGVKAAIAVRDGAFTGAYDKVWFFRDAFAAFVQALAHFTRTHGGEVRQTNNYGPVWYTASNRASLPGAAMTAPNAFLTPPRPQAKEESHDPYHTPLRRAVPHARTVSSRSWANPR